MIVEGEGETAQSRGFEMEAPVLRCVWPGDGCPAAVHGRALEQGESPNTK